MPLTSSGMARYNRWQNENLYIRGRPSLRCGEAAEPRRFLGSIHATLNHLLWADRTWMARFSDWPKPDAGIPQSVSLFPDWDNLKQERAESDAKLIAWSDAARSDMDCRRADLVFRRHPARGDANQGGNLTHFFQPPNPSSRAGHAMLTQAGGKPHDTDLFVMPE